MFHFFGKGSCFSTSLEKGGVFNHGKEAEGMAVRNRNREDKASQSRQSFGKGRGVCGRIGVSKQTFVSMGKGALSATLIRELADCAIQDGAQHTDLLAIAQTGNWGAQPGNVHRQILNHFCSNVQLAASHDVEVPCTHPKTSKDALEKASVFLPHMMFYCFIAWVKATQKYFSNSFALEKASWQASGKELPKQKMKN